MDSHHPDNPADRILARHHSLALGAEMSFCLAGPAELGRRQISEALSAAVAELRAVEAAFSPYHPRSLVCAVRRGELDPDGYPPPLVEIVAACAAMRAATDGWFDAWALPGGFDPGGLLRGWAVDRAAGLLGRAGIADFAIRAGSDRLVRGAVPTGRDWAVTVTDPRHGSTVIAATAGALAVSGNTAGRVPGQPAGRIVDPHTGGPARAAGPAAVSGPSLATANAYAVALCSAGTPGVDWFPTPDGYQAVLADGRRCPQPWWQHTAPVPAGQPVPVA